jgi:HK97 gp10 family phage protein
MEEACKILEDSAKGAIGTYEFGWPPLAESTLARKAADTPLLETGELRDSIRHTVESPKTGWVGTNDEKAAWHEFGTSRIPARPFLGGAVAAKGEEVKEVFGKEAMMVIQHKK